MFRLLSLLPALVLLPGHAPRAEVSAPPVNPIRHVGLGAAGTLPFTASRNPTPGSFDVTSYRLALRLQSSPVRLLGSVDVEAVCQINGLDSMKLDLIRSAMRVDSVRIRGYPAAFRQDAATVTITLDRGYNIGNRVGATVYYHNAVESAAGGGIEFSVDGAIRPWIWSMGEPSYARYWWPCRDHPADKADSVDVIVTVDSGLTAVSNGVLVSSKSNDDHTTTYHWHERYPIATYLVAIAVATYSRSSEWLKFGAADSVEIVSYALPENESEADTAFRHALGGLSVFSRYFGLYPFAGEKYGHAQVGGNLGIENQTLTTIDSRNFNELTVVHELAHQWFGDMITCRSWSDIWLNEGFSTYCEALYLERMYGKKEYAAKMAENMSSAMTARGTLIRRDTADVNVLFAPSVVYRKGAVVLHMLRHVLGDSTFFRAMYDYANDPSVKYASASTADFERICERSSGRSLKYFFDEWIYGDGYPVYAFRWSSIPRGSEHLIRITINQTAAGAVPRLFTMPVDIRLSTPEWDTTVTVLNDPTTEEFSFLLPVEPSSVSLDPGNWVLKECAESPPGRNRK